MQICRFEAKVGSPFAGTLINRDKPLEFAINGRKFTAYEGDTLLSALLANGCKSWRKSDSSNLSLNPRSILSLTTREVGEPDDEFWCGDRALRNGLTLETEPTRNMLGKLARSMQAGKDACLVTKNSHQRSPLEHKLASSQTGEFVVIGGGIAGMRAALIAASEGRQVTLFERSNRLGGMCDYYGQAEDEEAPHALIERLSAQVLANNKIDVRLCSEVLDVRPNRILVLSSDVSSKLAAKQSLFWTSFSHLALAVGADYGDQTPLEQGNVGYAHHVFRMAVDYGVRPAAQLSILTGGNSGYRLGQLLLEAGIDLDGIYDPRLEPTSRHIDFAKAVGVHMHFGQTPLSVSAGQTGVEVEFSAASFAGGKNTKKQFENLIVSQAPAANLPFWVRSGGYCELGENDTIGVTTSFHSNVALVGAASGSMTQTACISQAEELAYKLLGNIDTTKSTYTGLYKYESLPQRLNVFAHATTEQGIRGSANAPAFASKPSQNAISEFLFERSAAGKTISQVQAIGAVAIPENSFAKTEELHFSQHLQSRFTSPCVATLSPEGYLNLAIGQLIYDGDGVNQTPLLCGVVVDVAGEFAAVLEDRFYQSGQKLFVRTRSGYFAATIGERIDA